jgi:hypothetical protein
VLEALAGVQLGEENNYDLPRRIPMLWLTNNFAKVQELGNYHRWLLFLNPNEETSLGNPSGGLAIRGEVDLAQQLQRPLASR